VVGGVDTDEAEVSGEDGVEEGIPSDAPLFVSVEEGEGQGGEKGDLPGGPGGEAEGFVDGLDAFQHDVIVFYDVYDMMCLKKIIQEQVVAIVAALNLDACCVMMT